MHTEVVTGFELLPTPVPEVIQQNLDGGAVLFLPAEEIYFGLNAVGAEVWALLPPERKTFAELCDALCERYQDVERSVIEADVRELLADMFAHKLVTPIRAGQDGDAGHSRRA